VSRRPSSFAPARFVSSLPRVPHTLGVRFRTTLRAGALLLLSALPAVAQDPDPLAKLEPKSRFAIELLIDSAETAGIPTRPLLSKALEGIAKKADDRKIVVEVRRKFEFLKTARVSLGPVDEEELNAAASVLEAGGKPDQLGPFRARQKSRSDLEAFTVWADFLARGIPKEEAFSAISTLWRDGADDATFHSLWNNVQTDILQGLNPGAALQNRIRESPGRAPTTAGKPPEGPQENQSSR
jgi:hypothetical protein